MMQFLKPGFVQIAFGGETGGGGGGSDRAPSTRPQQRPSIMTVQRTPQDERQRVATRDMPRFGISAGDTTSEPSYSPFSLQGLTSTDPANVMRNIQGAERNLRANPPGGGDDNDRPEPAPAPTPPPVTTAPVDDTPAPPPPAPPVETESGLTPAQEERIETAGEEAAERQRQLGLAQTIATSPRGLLAGGQGTTRRRRSLIGGGLIV